MRRFLLLAALLGPVAPAATAGDAEAGRTAFARRCMACHAAQPGQNRIGPSLHAVFGRPAAQVTGFNYSPALRDSGRTWDEPTLHAYLLNPRELIPGNRMVMPGIQAEEERANIIAYLDTLR